MSKRTRNWILAIVAVAIIAAVGYVSKRGDEMSMQTETGATGSAQ